jgi:hypothetical protein
MHMAQDDPESGSRVSPPNKEQELFVNIRLIPRSFVVHKKGKEAFWQAYREFIDRPPPTPTRSLPSDWQTRKTEDFENLIRQKFPGALEERFKSALTQAYPPGTADPNLEARRRRALAALAFRLKGEISYGTIGIPTVAEHLDDIFDAFTLTVGVVTTILNWCAPGALNDALGIEEPQWGAESLVIPGRPVGQPQRGLRGLFASLRNQTFVYGLLNSLWFLPVAVALFLMYVMVLTYHEMNGRIDSYDKGLLEVRTDEIKRLSDRSARFDQQEASLLQRQQALLEQEASFRQALFKESSDWAKALLNEELQRAIERSDYFDKQRALLLQRYENMSKEEAETLRTLIQQSSCCKPSNCDPKGEKSRPKKSEGGCRKSAD